jgi:hypothetical protein
MLSICDHFRCVKKLLKKEINHKLIAKRHNKIEKKQEELGKQLFVLQDELTEIISKFYQIENVSSEWYIQDDSVHMTFRWLDTEFILRSEHRKPVLEGCPRRLRRSLIRNQTILEFMLLDQEYSLLYLI